MNNPKVEPNIVLLIINKNNIIVVFNANTVHKTNDPFIQVVHPYYDIIYIYDNTYSKQFLHYIRHENVHSSFGKYVILTKKSWIYVYKKDFYKKSKTFY